MKDAHAWLKAAAEVFKNLNKKTSQGTRAGFARLGSEVIYTGLRQTPEMIVDAALREDVRIIGLSVLSGAHQEGLGVRVPAGRAA